MATREYQFIVGPETSTLPTIGSPSASTDLITLGFADSNYTQGKQSVADITALKAVTNTGDGARADGDVIEVQSTNSVYVFDAGSAATGNDDTIVEPTAGTGRWLKVAQAISVSTDNRLPKFDGVGGALQTSGITVDDSNNVTGVNDLTVTGDLTVNGTTTTLNTQTLDVEDANITINKGGNDASSEGSGLAIDRNGTKGALIYAAAAASKFKIGNLASEVEVADISTAQTLTNKTISYASNTLTGVQPVSTLTTKGDLYVATAASTVTRQGVGSDGQVLTADSAQTNGLKWAAPASAPDYHFELSNFSLSTSVASNALTIAVKDKSGSDPSGGSSVKVGFRNSTLTNGTYNQRTITSALSMTISSGSTLGHQSAKEEYIYVYLIDNSGTVEMAVSSKYFDSFGVVSTTAEGGAGAADNGSTMYSTTARTSVPFRFVGRLRTTQTTAGTWDANMSQIDLVSMDLTPQAPCYFRLVKNGNQTITGGAGVTIVTTWIETDDNRDTINNSSGVMTVYEDGLYQFNYQVSFGTGATATGEFFAGIYIDGNRATFTDTTDLIANKGYTFSAGIITKLLKNQTVDLRASSSNQNVTIDGTLTFFNGALVGRI